MRRLSIMAILAAALVGCRGGLLATASAPPGGSLGRLQVRIVSARPVQSLVQALDPQIADVKFTISGPNVPAGTPVLDVPRSAFSSGAAVANWSNLLPGSLHMVVQVFDSTATELAHASGDTQIVAGQTAQMLLSVVPDTGAVSVSADLSALDQPASLSLTFGGVPPHSWQEGPPLIIARTSPSAVVVDGTLFVVGGDSNSEMEEYDPVSGTWSPLLFSQDGVKANLLGQAAPLGDRIVVVGRDQELLGMPEDASPVFLDPFAPGALSEQPAPSASPGYLTDLQSPRTAVGVASDGQTLYMVGGTSKRNLKGSSTYVFVDLGLLETLSSTTTQWTARAPMPTPRAALGTALLDGKLYAAGGFQWSGTPTTDPLMNQPGIVAAGAQMTPVSTLEAYDPATDSWSELAPMPTARYGLALVAASGRLYAIGGTSATTPALATVESYDPVSNTWRTEPSLPVARTLAGATALGDEILVAGGIGTSGIAMRSVEVFNTEALP